MDTEIVTSALASTGIAARVLAPADRESLVARLRDRLGADVSAHAPWDDETAPDGRQRPDGWELVARHVWTESCLMFPDGAPVVWEFESGADLHGLLRECPPFEFYVCDRAASYLLCSNHHDFVIGWGSAQPWLDSLGDP